MINRARSSFSPPAHSYISALVHFTNSLSLFRLKKFSAHISLVFLVLFGITLLPFNFLHQHAEDEHGMAIHRHESKEKHHCELDDRVCQPFEKDCDHEQHVSRTIAKCFSCEFHFIKHFISGTNNIAFVSLFISAQYKLYPPDQVRQALILLTNKGPPRFTTV